MNSIADKLARIKESVALSCETAGRSGNDVQLMAVSKNNDRAAILEAMAAGQLLFGENRVQEAVAKFSSIESEYQLHMIGHLQRNKARDALKYCCCIQSVDSLRLARRLSEIATETSRCIDLLVEMNTSGEVSKFGLVGVDALRRLLDECFGLPGLTVRGLRRMAALTAESGLVRKSFRTLASMFEMVKTEYAAANWDTLSMGMSSDYTIAIEEGSTLVRIGTAIFGVR